MARAHFVKKARKDNPAVKAGESYWWWSTRITVGKRYMGHKHYSATRPTRSQLTSSPFYSELFRIEDEILTGFDGADKSTVETIKEEAESDLGALKDEVQGSLDNMPEQLHESPTGVLLENRIYGLDEMITELENIDLDNDLEDVVSAIEAVEYQGE